MAAMLAEARSLSDGKVEQSIIINTLYLRRVLLLSANHAQNKKLN